MYESRVSPVLGIVNTAGRTLLCGAAHQHCKRDGGRGTRRPPCGDFGADDRTVRVSDPASGTSVGGPFTGHTDWVRAVAAAELDGRPVVISGADDRTVRVWDFGTPIGDPFTGHTGWVRTVAASNLDGRPVVVSGATTQQCGYGVWPGDEACDATCAAFGYTTRHLFAPRPSCTVRIA